MIAHDQSHDTGHLCKQLGRWGSGGQPLLQPVAGEHVRPELPQRERWASERIFAVGVIYIQYKYNVDRLHVYSSIQAIYTSKMCTHVVLVHYYASVSLCDGAWH